MKNKRLCFSVNGFEAKMPLRFTPATFNVETLLFEKKATIVTNVNTVWSRFATSGRMNLSFHLKDPSDDNDDGDGDDGWC